MQEGAQSPVHASVSWRHRPFVVIEHLFSGTTTVLNVAVTTRQVTYVAPPPALSLVSGYCVAAAQRHKPGFTHSKKRTQRIRKFRRRQTIGCGRPQKGTDPNEKVTRRT